MDEQIELLIEVAREIQKQTQCRFSAALTAASNLLVAAEVKVLREKGLDVNTYPS